MKIYWTVLSEKYRPSQKWWSYNIKLKCCNPSTSDLTSQSYGSRNSFSHAHILNAYSCLKCLHWWQEGSYPKLLWLFKKFALDTGMHKSWNGDCAICDIKGKSGWLFVIVLRKSSLLGPLSHTVQFIYSFTYDLCTYCFADTAKGDGRDPGTKFGMGFVCYCCVVCS